MNETVLCPFCQAQLTLPSAAEKQAVQCPRCGREFEPSRKPASASSSSDRSARGATKTAPLGGEWKATLAMALLAGCILGFACQLYVNTVRLSLLNEKQDIFNEDFNFRGPGNGALVPPEFLDRWDHWDRTAGNMVRFSVVLFLATTVAFFLWLHQVAANLRLLQADGLTHSPATALLSFFIPVVNIVRPCAILQEISQASDPRTIRSARAWKSASPLHTITLWWLCFLGACGSALLCMWVASNNPDLDIQQITVVLWCASNMAMILAAILLMLVIHTLEQRQQERYAKLLEDEED
ncbi:MAG: DUF4328 domain-containing protein [Planctomycetes bacterium]|nr:DUF4328 domain-containing protein [Planctomycetota bacterium]